MFLEVKFLAFKLYKQGGRCGQMDLIHVIHNVNLHLYKKILVCSSIFLLEKVPFLAFLGIQR